VNKSIALFLGLLAGCSGEVQLQDDDGSAGSAADVDFPPPQSCAEFCEALVSIGCKNPGSPPGAACGCTAGPEECRELTLAAFDWILEHMDRESCEVRCDEVCFPVEECEAAHK